MDFNIVDYKGNTPLILSVLNNNVSTFKFLIRSFEKGRIFLDITTQNNSGKTALDIAIEMNIPIFVGILT